MGVRATRALAIGSAAISGGHGGRYRDDLRSGVLFLVLKGFEYREDIAKWLVPGAGFPLTQAGADLFFSFYWIMTGLHAVHVSGGLVALARLLIAGSREPAWLSGSASEEATALYWHLIDVIWIVLYPLLYLAGRAGG